LFGLAGSLGGVDLDDPVHADAFGSVWPFETFS
jgi:hypothetical protein